MTLSTQFLTMLSMIGMGALFGVMFDTYQRFLDRPRRNRFIVFVNDILFWIIQALLIFYILFQVNNGEIRFYIFIALLCGFAGYQGLFKGPYLRLLELLITAVISIYRFLKHSFLMVVYKPIVGLIKLVIFMVIFLGRGLYTLVKFILKVVWLILKVIVIPVQKILLLIWRLLPKGLKKSVDKLYNRTAGKFKKMKNYIVKWIDKWKKRKQ
ncbi:spore cortex biosynthesis protein YabQ [Neobacillus cucumis]|uniref:spore cortex biosynthesis protein YabQ n=1 Tax=Neobacillus cucumis TaxID=1740721 RepID=UPI0018DF685E|nr:spore cortex biosynthesis protein YabQ [Neobacillus cucumis]MBI0581113.1 spore cortex biosynthesis protein YabQ [Neobacillus cucumis]WHY92049.1 spore cortex biosynthesis protein YabQ [Neobacillus cucumis]